MLSGLKVHTGASGIYGFRLSEGVRIMACVFKLPGAKVS